VRCFRVLIICRTFLFQARSKVEAGTLAYRKTINYNARVSAAIAKAAEDASGTRLHTLCTACRLKLVSLIRGARQEHFLLVLPVTVL
jgi:hypothetical protein